MPEASLDCYTRRDGPRTILALEGTLDVATAPAAVDAFQRYTAEHGPHLTVDTSRLDFIDSKGVGVLLGAAKAAKDAGGALYLPHPATPVRKILETCGLMSLFPNSPPLPSQTETAEKTAEKTAPGTATGLASPARGAARPRKTA
jgi:anti-anti-sigma factor